ncbi:MAG: hypothetical protein Q3971_01625 [Moraxella sp.]|nr:hypothetical protein [Moraxella sp.]
MKKLSILALTATVAIVPAFAETNVNYNTPSVDIQPDILLDVSQQSTLPTTAQADLSFAFGDVENLQAVAMTDKEMKETEGAAIHPAVFIYGVRYGIPAMYAGARWLNANSHNVQIWQHRTRNLWNKR